MRQRIPIGAWILAILLMWPLAALAQIPRGVQVPGTSALPRASLPTKDGLLQRAKGMVADLTTSKLAEYATTLNDLQKQVGMLKTAIK